MENNAPNMLEKADDGRKRDPRRDVDNIRIKPALCLVGVKTRLDSSDGKDNYEKALAFFDECEANGTLARLRDVASEKWPCFFGACTNFGKKSYDYWITVAVDRAEEEHAEVPAGMEDLYTEEGEFAVFTATGAAPGSVSTCWRGIYNDWFLNHDFVHLDKPELEMYPFGYMKSDDYSMEIWVPVKLAPIRRPPDRRGQLSVFFGMMLGVTLGAVIGSSSGNMTLGLIIGAVGGAVVGTMLRKKTQEKDKDKDKDGDK